MVSYAINTHQAPQELVNALFNVLRQREALKRAKDVYEDILLGDFGGRFYGSTSAFYGFTIQGSVPSFLRCVPGTKGTPDLWFPDERTVTGRRVAADVEGLWRSTNTMNDVVDILKAYGVRVKKPDISFSLDYQNDNFIVNTELVFKKSMSWCVALDVDNQDDTMLI